MRTNRSCVNTMLTTTAILACILLPVIGFAAELSVNDQLLRAAHNGSLEQIKTLVAKGGVAHAKDETGETALSFAGGKNGPAIEQLLKARGAK
jgi:hypothetical protein